MKESQSAVSQTGIYRSYLVRVWRSNEQGSWRASAQSIQSSTSVQFGDVESLLTFLKHEVNAEAKQAAKLQEERNGE